MPQQFAGDHGTGFARPGDEGAAGGRRNPDRPDLLVGDADSDSDSPQDHHGKEGLDEGNAAGNAQLLLEDQGNEEIETCEDRDPQKEVFQVPHGDARPASPVQAERPDGESLEKEPGLHEEEDLSGIRHPLVLESQHVGKRREGYDPKQVDSKLEALQHPWMAHQQVSYGSSSFRRYFTPGLVPWEGTFQPALFRAGRTC